MKRIRFEAPRLLVSGESMLGHSAARRDRGLDLAARCREPESLAVALSKALDAGAEGVLWDPTPTLRAACEALRRAVPLYARVPEVPAEELHVFDSWLADASGHGLHGAGPAARARLVLRSLGQTPAPLTGSLYARVAALIELGIAALPARALCGIAVAAPITDLALAAGNRTFFERTCGFARGSLHAAAGFETNNLGLLLARLEEWGVAPDLVVGPVNPRGWRMKPDPAAVLAALARGVVPVVAKELCAAGTVALDEGVAFARAHGAHGVTIDLADLEDVGSDLRRLGG